ncbi:MAG: putative 2-dehydropantoate 2-reductase [Bacteroidales bacterium]|nr:putative 2-dehydropantoate 2-reductase [Bacteroidales bacterium]MBO5835934.1 putative 2-dehydropantoate 2-reductase [Bacteroidales bacterium]
MKRRYAIVGVGGIGGYYGGRLAQSGQEVHFLCRSDYQHIKEHGLKVESVKGDFHLTQVNAYNDAKQMPPCDVILVCTKTLSNHQLKEILPSLVHQDSLVILVQNGLGMEQTLAQALPDIKIAGATAFICSFKVGQGHIRHAEYGELSLSPYHACVADSLKQVALDLQQAGIPTQYVDDLNYLRWKKLVWNIPYNGLTVLMNASTDKLTFDADSRPLLQDLMREVIEAAAACGATIPFDFIDKMIASTEKMTPYSPSMKLDYEASRPMEIDTMYTCPILTARAAGYEMKKTAVLEQQLRFKEKYRL